MKKLKSISEQEKFFAKMKVLKCQQKRPVLVVAKIKNLLMVLMSLYLQSAGVCQSCACQTCSLSLQIQARSILQKIKTQLDRWLALLEMGGLVKNNHLGISTDGTGQNS